MSEAARAEIGRLIEQAHADGETYAAIAEAIGVSEVTVGRWRDLGKVAKLATVRIVEAPAPAKRGIVVHGPRGLRIEGMTLDELAELWSRLSS